MNRSKILNKAITDCIWEMYRRATPPLTKKEAEKQHKEDPERDILWEHYLSAKEQDVIAQKYIDAYGIEDKWKEYVDVIIRDFKEGHTKDKYIERDGDTPGYRDYEKVPPLKDIIGEEAANKVLEILEDRKYFYRFGGRDESTFRFNVFNFSPCSNKKTVEEKLGITIKDRDPEKIEDYHLDFRNYIKG